VTQDFPRSRPMADIPYMSGESSSTHRLLQHNHWPRAKLLQPSIRIRSRQLRRARGKSIDLLDTYVGVTLENWDSLSGNKVFGGDPGMAGHFCSVITPIQFICSGPAG